MFPSSSQTYYRLSHNFVNFFQRFVHTAAVRRAALVRHSVDATVTMLGQPKEYWMGSYELVNEFNPIARWLLIIHPIGIVIYTILDIAAVSMLILLLPVMLSKILAAFWAIGSAKAIYNCLVGPLHMGWWFSTARLIIYFTFYMHA